MSCFLTFRCARKLCADPKTGSLPPQLVDGAITEEHDEPSGRLKQTNTRDSITSSNPSDDTDMAASDPYRMLDDQHHEREEGAEIRDWAMELLNAVGTNGATTENGASTETLAGSDIGVDAPSDKLPKNKSDLEKLKADEEPLTPAERMALIEEEFGPWDGPGEETFLEQMPVTLYRDVLVKGALAMTNKRLVYLAYLPKFEKGKVLKSGYVTVQTSGRGPFARKMRRWAELRSDTMTAHRDSSSVYKPTFSVALSAIRSIAPMDPKNPRTIRIRFVDGHVCEVSLDTIEAAEDWQKEWVGALFQYRAKSDKLRASIPLRRIQGVSTYISEAFARVMDLKIETGASACQFQSIVEGEDSTSRDVSFAYLLAYYDPFYQRLENRVELAKADPEQHDLSKVPAPVLEVGHCDKPGSEDDDEKDSDPAQEDVDMPEMARRFIKTFVLECEPKDLFSECPPSLA